MASLLRTIRPSSSAQTALPRRWSRLKRKARFDSLDLPDKDPQVHLAMLNTGFPFDAVQMPLNPFDSTFRSFETQVLPEVIRRGMAPLGMKPMSGAGPAI